MNPTRLVGEARVPGDKSIAHRALILAAMADGASLVRGLPRGGDVSSTIACLAALGVRCEEAGDGLRVEGAARWRDGRELDAANSGTTARLLAGALAGRGTAARIVGDASLSRRPMDRVARPLRALGARIETTGDGTLPLSVQAAPLRAASWRAEVPSAQVKSAFLLAALGAPGVSRHVESVPTRDHLERLLPAFGIRVEREGGSVVLEGPQSPRGTEVVVPGDPSSAAQLLIAASILPGSRVTVRDVSLNPTRTGWLDALESMGAIVERCVEDEGAEPRGSVSVEGPAALRPVVVGREDVPRAVDELPLLALAAACAEGESRLAGLGELRVKESDRASATVRLLRALNCECDVGDNVGGDVGDDVGGDVLVVRGPARGPTGSSEPLDAGGDHRIAMVHRIAALRWPGLRLRDDRDAVVGVSWPGFHDALDVLRDG